MEPPLATVRDGALDRALAEPDRAREHLAFAGAVATAPADAERLPLPLLV